MSKRNSKPATRSRVPSRPAPRQLRARVTPQPIKRKLPLLQAPRSQVPCLECGLCCTYIAVEIDAPDTLHGATEILWYLYHRDVSIYLEDDEWMVQFATRCNNLQDDNRCGIYETRPPVCREFKETTCEVNAADVGISFYTPQAFLDYLAQHHKRIYALVRKRYLPSESIAQRARLGSYRGRFEALRMQGAR